MTAPLIAIVRTALKKAIEAAEEATVETNQVFLNGTWAPTFLKIPIEKMIPGKLKNKLVVPCFLKKASQLDFSQTWPRHQHLLA